MVPTDSRDDRAQGARTFAHPLTALDRRAWTVIAACCLVLACYAAAIVYFSRFDAAYRTIFVEEFHTGEAGRARHLFGTWLGEAGRWQSIVTTPLSSIIAWVSFSSIGFGLFQLRLPYAIISILSIVMFAAAAWREAKHAPALAVAASSAFMLSPFMTALRATSLNELIYPLVVSTMLLLLLKAEGAGDVRIRSRASFLVGFVGGSALLVKLDGFLIPAALLLFLAVEALRKSLSWRDLTAVVAGGSAVGICYAIIVLTVVGYDRYADGLLMTNEAMARFRPYDRSLAERVTSALIVFPLNIDVFIAGGSFLLAAGILLGLAGYRHLSTAGKYCLIFSVLLFAWSLFTPLVYWKKIVIAVVPTLYLGLAVASLSLSNKRTFNKKLVLIAVGIAVVYSVAVYCSQFKAMWAAAPFWERASSFSATALAIGVLAITAAAIAAWQNKAQYIFPALFLASCLATAVSGIKLLANFPQSSDAHAIGEAIGPKIDGSRVVGDYNGFRFVGYFTTASFSIVNEADTAYPDQIYRYVEEKKPDYILVTDVYRTLSKEIATRFPSYRLIASYPYEHPVRTFNEPVIRHVVHLYENPERAGAQR